MTGAGRFGAYVWGRGESLTAAQIYITATGALVSAVSTLGAKTVLLSAITTLESGSIARGAFTQIQAAGANVQVRSFQVSSFNLLRQAAGILPIVSTNRASGFPLSNGTSILWGISSERISGTAVRYAQGISNGSTIETGTGERVQGSESHLAGISSTTISGNRIQAATTLLLAAETSQAFPTQIQYAATSLIVSSSTLSGFSALSVARGTSLGSLLEQGTGMRIVLGTGVVLPVVIDGSAAVLLSVGTGHVHSIASARFGMQVIRTGTAVSLVSSSEFVSGTILQQAAGNSTVITWAVPVGQIVMVSRTEINPTGTVSGQGMLIMSGLSSVVVGSSSETYWAGIIAGAAVAAPGSIDGGRGEHFLQGIGRAVLSGDTVASLIDRLSQAIGNVEMISDVRSERSAIVERTSDVLAGSILAAIGSHHQTAAGSARICSVITSNEFATTIFINVPPLPSRTVIFTRKKIVTESESKSLALPTKRKTRVATNANGGGTTIEINRRRKL